MTSTTAPALLGCVLLCVSTSLGSLSACSEAPDAPAGAGGGGGGTGGVGGEPLACVPPESEEERGCVVSGTPEDACADGFSPDGHGGCLPILPEATCPDGQVALMGETTCRPLLDCGTETWSNIPVEAGTEYVDPSYAGNDSDGSVSRPWTDPQDAVDNADEGDIVALAAGAYGTPPALLSKRLRLWGRCPELVGMSLTGIGQALYMDVSGQEVHQIAFSGDGVPLVISDAEDVILDRVWVHDTADVGILVTNIGNPTSIVIRDSLVERAGALGVLILSSDAEITGTVVRDTVANALGPGRGIDIEFDPEYPHVPQVAITRSLVRNARETSFACLGATCTLEQSALIGTRSQPDGRYGSGIAVQYAYAPANATVTQSYIGDMRMFGISVVNSSLVMRDSTIDGVARQELGDDFGDGVAVVHATDELDLSATFLRTRIAGAARAGIANFAGEVSVEAIALECNTIPLDGEYLSEKAYVFTNGGGNACWCADAVAPCKVFESQLKPPPGP